jgi:hypothetical protein
MASKVSLHRAPAQRASAARRRKRQDAVDHVGVAPEPVRKHEGTVVKQRVDQSRLRSARGEDTGAPALEAGVDVVDRPRHEPELVGADLRAVTVAQRTWSWLERTCQLLGSKKRLNANTATESWTAV